MKTFYTVTSNEKIASLTYRMTLCGDTSFITRPGQFINIALKGLYLRRPISVCDWDAKTLTVIYKVVGRGTKLMSEMRPGSIVDTLSGLGNGYDITKARGKKILIVGGGAGVPPLIGLARILLEHKESVRAVLGFNDRASVYGADYLRTFGIETAVTTMDGSFGTKGVVTDLMKDMDYEYYFACGNQAMLAAVHALGKEGQLSLEARMGCGVGMCMGCSCKTLSGYKRVCTEGPVVLSSEVLFDEE